MKDVYKRQTLCFRTIDNEKRKNIYFYLFSFVDVYKRQVDGMPIGGGLDFVNPNDIESIAVLKDAASGAIYGARAANGLSLIHI